MDKGAAHPDLVHEVERLVHRLRELGQLPPPHPDRVAILEEARAYDVTE